MSSGPRLASVIVNWNNYEATRAFVASFARAPYPDHEVIVVDNNSPNGSTKRIEAEFPEYTYIYNDENVGIAAANNIAMRHALARGARYIFFFNNDLELIEEDFFTKMVSYMEQHPRAGMAAPQLLHPDGRLQPSVKLMQTPFNQCAEWLWLRSVVRRMNVGRPHSGPLRASDFVMASALLVRKEAIEDIGPEDERFFLGYEDMDWCERAREKGWSVDYIPEARVTHWHGVSSKGLMSNFDYYFQEKLRYLMKHYPQWQNALFRLCVSFGSLARAVAGSRAHLRLAYRIWTYPWSRGAYLTPARPHPSV